MKLLIIDDEKSLLKLLQMSLADAQTEVLVAETGSSGLELAARDTFDSIICDIGLPDLDGLEVLRRLKAQRPETPVIMITAHGTVASALSAMKSGAYDYVPKPFEPEELKLVVQRALHE